MSELYMRSLQMYNLFAGKKPVQPKPQRTITTRKVTPALEAIESHSLEGLEEMKKAVIVRIVLRKMLCRSAWHQSIIGVR